jgi:predicted nucleic acid-binding protein
MFLVDTNVVSELRKARSGKANAGVIEWAQSVQVSELFISAITVFEIERGIFQLERKDTAQGAILRAWLDQHVLPGFAGRILAVDTAVSLRCAHLPIPDPKRVSDALIAATAIVHGMTVVTRNEADFVQTGVPLLNPWR